MKLIADKFTDVENVDSHSSYLCGYRSRSRRSSQNFFKKIESADTMSRLKIYM